MGFGILLLSISAHANTIPQNKIACGYSGADLSIVLGEPLENGASLLLKNYRSVVENSPAKADGSYPVLRFELDDPRVGKLILRNAQGKYEIAPGVQVEGKSPHCEIEIAREVGSAWVEIKSLRCENLMPIQEGKDVLTRWQSRLTSVALQAPIRCYVWPDRR